MGVVIQLSIYQKAAASLSISLPWPTGDSFGGLVVVVLERMLLIGGLSLFLSSSRSEDGMPIVLTWLIVLSKGCCLRKHGDWSR